MSSLKEDRVLDTSHLRKCDYSIERSIGKGGFGEVFLARSQKGAQVALKRILKSTHKSHSDSIQREITAGRHLRHLNIIQFIECFETPTSFYLVMEYFEGIDLLRFLQLRNFKPLPERNSKKLFIQLVHAIAYCHDQGIAHRDIKLENILVNQNGTIKLLDFGLCHMTVRSKTRKDCKNLQGSCGYIPPEVRKGEAYSAFPVDIWGLGVVLWALLWARLPTFSSDPLNIKAIPEGHPVVPFPNPKISSGCKDLLFQLLSIDPAHRPTAKDLLQHHWQKNLCMIQ